ncbi:MAG: thiamine-phosphate kinase [Pirellula sp.]|jgi:thiamine-monophosphate kinase|nr:thiamine-phosphate kinase [Pirellula sp.]
MEHSFIAWAKQRASKLPRVKLGIGDDCALLSCSPAARNDQSSLDQSAQCDDWVVTTDSLCEGTHFILADCGPKRAGRKLMAVNLSDLASMAAMPVAVFLSLCLPRKGAGDIAAQVFEGVYELAKEFHVSIAGGDTNVWDGPLVLHLTAIGQCPVDKAWKRSTAQIDDAVFVSGSLGGSILGHHLDFTPRLRLAEKLAALDVVSAATDISDGLGVDLLNITAASRCGAELDLDSIPISESARTLSESSGKEPVMHAIGDGEDFELLFTVPQDKIALVPSDIDGISLTRIGKIVSRTGLWAKDKRGVRQLPPNGYVHGS